MTTDLEYLYQDDYLFAVYKPALLHSVRAGDDGGPSIADLLLTYRPELEYVAPRPGDAGLVSRLDFGTSGVLLGCTTTAIWNDVHAELLEGRVVKQYLALIEGALAEAAVVSTFLGTPHRGAKKTKIYVSEPSARARALPGTTHFDPLFMCADNRASLVKVSASPARRHQIRAHAAFIGHPLVGDELYGSANPLTTLFETDRPFLLHSERVELTHPVTGERLEINAALREAPLLHAQR